MMVKHLMSLKVSWICQRKATVSFHCATRMPTAMWNFSTFRTTLSNTSTALTSSRIASRFVLTLIMFTFGYSNPFVLCIHYRILRSYCKNTNRDSGLVAHMQCGGFSSFASLAVGLLLNLNLFFSFAKYAFNILRSHPELFPAIPIRKILKSRSTRC